MSHPTTEQDIALIQANLAQAWQEYQQHHEINDYELAELWFQQWLIWQRRLNRYRTIMGAYL